MVCVAMLRTNLLAHAHRHTLHRQKRKPRVQLARQQGNSASQRQQQQHRLPTLCRVSLALHNDVLAALVAPEQGRELALVLALALATGAQVPVNRYASALPHLPQRQRSLHHRLRRASQRPTS